MEPLALLIWVAILALLLAPGVAIITSKRATAKRKLLWVGIMLAGYVTGEVIAGLYARGRVNPLHPESPESFVAMVIEISLTITLVWVAYAGFLFHTRQRKAQ